MKTIICYLRSTIYLWLVIINIAQATQVSAAHEAALGDCLIHSISAEVISCSNFDYDLEVTVSHTGQGLLAVSLNNNALGIMQQNVNTTTATTTVFSFSALPSTGEVVEVVASLTDDKCDLEPYEFITYTSPTGCCSLDALTATALCTGADYAVEVIATFSKSSPVEMELVLTNSSGTVIATQHLPSAQSGEAILLEHLDPDNEVVQVQATIYGQGCDSPKTVLSQYTAPAGCCEIIFGEIYTECEDLEHYSLSTEIGYLGEGPFNLSVQLNGGSLGSYAETVEGGSHIVTFDGLVADAQSVEVTATVSGGSCQSNQTWTSTYNPPSCNGPCGIQFVGLSTQCDNANEYTANFDIHYTGYPDILQVELSGGTTATQAIGATSSPQTISIGGLSLSEDNVQVIATATGGDCAAPETFYRSYVFTPDDCNSNPVNCSINNLTVNPICTGTDYKTEVRVSFAAEENTSLQISLDDGQVQSQTIYPSSSPVIVYFSDLNTATGTVTVQAQLNSSNCISPQTTTTTYTAPTACEASDCTLERIESEIDCKGDAYDLTAYLHYTGNPNNFFVQLEEQQSQAAGTTNDAWQQTISTTSNPAVVRFKNLPVGGGALKLSADMMSVGEVCEDQLSVGLSAPSTCPCQVDTIVYEQLLNGNLYDLKTKVHFFADGPARLRLNLSNGLSQERLVDFSPATFLFEEMICTGTPMTIETYILEGDCGDQVGAKTVVLREPLNCDGGLPPNTYCKEDCNITIGEAYIPTQSDINRCLDCGVDPIEVCYKWEPLSAIPEGVDPCSQTIDVCPEDNMVYRQIVTDNCGNILEEKEYPVQVRCAEVSITPNPIELCETGGSLILNAGKFYQIYQWSTGETSRTIEITQPGTYSVTVTDFYGCQASDEVIIEVGQASLSTFILPDEAAICPDGEVELTVQAIPNFSNLSYQWSTAETTASIIATEDSDYSVTVTDENGCIGVSEITVEDANNPENLEEYFFENGFVALPVRLSELPPAFTSDGSTSRFMSDDRLNVDVEVEGLGYINLLDLLNASSLATGVEQWLSHTCTDFQEFQELYETTSDVIWGHTVIEDENALTATLYLGGKTTSVPNDNCNWILDVLYQGWDVLKVDLEHFLSIDITISKLEQFTDSQLAKDWLDYIEELLATCNTQGFVPSTNGFIPKCFWENTLVQQQDQYTILDLPFAAGMADAAYASIEGIIQIVEGINDLTTALANYPYCRIRGFNNQEDYDALVAQMNELNENPTFWNNVTSWWIDNIDAREECLEQKATLDKVGTILSTIVDVLTDWDRLSDTYKAILNQISNYYETVSSDDNEGRYSFGRLVFDFASLFIGTGQVKVLDKLEDSIDFLKTLFAGRTQGLLNKMTREFVDEFKIFVQNNPAKKNIFKDDVANSLDEFWEFFNKTDDGIPISKKFGGWNELDDLGSSLKTNVSALKVVANPLFLTRLQANPNLIHFLENLTDVGRNSLANNVDEWIGYYDSRIFLRNGDYNNAINKVGGSRGTTPPNGYVSSPEPGALNRYQAIIQNPNQVSNIARNLAEHIDGSINPPQLLINRLNNVVSDARQHLFINTQMVETAPNIFTTGKFTPRNDIADIWENVANTAFDFDDAEALLALIKHEYVESKLISEGIIYARLNSGNSVPTSFRYGAHDLSPLDFPENSTFNHWLDIQRNSTPSTISLDFSNIDEVINQIKQIEGL